MKVLSCKVEDGIYNKIKNMEGTPSEILRSLIENYVKEHENNTNKVGIPQVYQVNTIDEYDLLRRCLDSIPRRLNKDFDKKEFD